MELGSIPLNYLPVGCASGFGAAGGGAVVLASGTIALLQTGQLCGGRPGGRGLSHFPKYGHGTARIVLALPQWGQAGFASGFPSRRRASSSTSLVNSLPPAGSVQSQ